MNAKFSITSVLVIAVSINSVSAENTMLNIGERTKEYADVLNEAEKSMIVYDSTISSILSEPKKQNSSKENLKDLVDGIKLPNNNPQKPKEPKATVDKPKESASVNTDKLKNEGKSKSTFFPVAVGKTISVKIQVRLNKNGKLEIATSAKKVSANELRFTWRVAKDSEIRKVFFIGKNIKQLTPQQNWDLKERLGAIVNSPSIKKFILTIRSAEHGGGLVIVGKGQGKRDTIKKRIKKLNYDYHPAEQLPSEAFPKNPRYGQITTASGELQILFSTWKPYKQHFGFNKKGKGSNNFSIRNQRIVGLDLARTSRGGKGFVDGLMKGNMSIAFKYGTQPWESSKDSKLGKGKIKTIDYNALSTTAKIAAQVANDKNV